MAGEHGALRLRLAVAAHAAIGHDAAVVENGERRVERVEGEPAGREIIERACSSEKLAPRFCIKTPVAGSTQPEPNSSRALDVGDDEAGGVGRAHPDGIAGAAATGQRAALWRSIFIASPAMKRSQERDRANGKVIRIGDDAIAHAQRALGRLDQTVDVIESLGLLDAELGKQSEDQQRDDALRRRTGIVERARRQRDAQRFGDFGFVALQIVARQRAADAFEIGGDFVATSPR